MASTREHGFTVVELTIVAALLLVVLATFFDVLQSASSSQVRVQALVANQESVRFGLDRVQRDLRAANPMDAAATTTGYRTSVQVELGPNPGTRVVIRWLYDTTPASPTYESLLRQVMSGPGTNATVVSQGVVLSRVHNAETNTPVFSYYDSHGNDLIAGNPTTPANVAACAIRMHIQVNADAQPGPLPFAENVDVELRNRLPGGIVGCPS